MKQNNTKICLPIPRLAFDFNDIASGTVSDSVGGVQGCLKNTISHGGYTETAPRFLRNKDSGMDLPPRTTLDLIKGKSGFSLSLWILSYQVYVNFDRFRLFTAYGEGGKEVIAVTYCSTSLRVRIPGCGVKDDILVFPYTVHSRVLSYYPHEANDGVWQHLTLTVDFPNHSVKLYVNGNEVLSEDCNVSFTCDSISDVNDCVYPDRIGGDSKGKEMSFNGVIDDFCLYDYALSKDEVTALYQSYGEPETLCPTRDQELVDILLAKLGDGVVLKAGTGNMIWKGHIVKADTEDYQNRNFLINRKLYTPASFAKRYFGKDIEKLTSENGKYDVKGLCEASGKRYIDLTDTKEGLFIILAEDSCLDVATDLVYIIRAGEFCVEKENEPRIPVEQTRSVIRYSNPSSKEWIYSPGIVELNGVYFASCDISNGLYTEVFRSDDGGKTWKSIAKIDQRYWWATLFAHNDDLYLIGIYGSSYFGSGDRVIKERYIGITKSTDGGYTWSEMIPESGLIAYEGKTAWELHRAPTAVIVHDSKIWVVFEDVGGYVHPREVLMSAPVDSDLLDPQSWHFYDYMTGQGWVLEGNPVAGKDGQIYVLSRHKDAHIMISKLVDNKLIYLDDVPFVEGPATKITVRYDKRTDRYLALTNVYCGDDTLINNRTNLALVTSPDMIHWQVAELLLCDRCAINDQVGISLHGYQYVDWVISGEDLLFCVRESTDDAYNWHDSNYLTFYRLSNYAQYLQ